MFYKKSIEYKMFDKQSISLITLVVLVALVGALAACGPRQLDEAERQVAELGARSYADRTESDYVSCSGQDSDKDGYVACSIKSRVKTKDLQDILCSYKVSSRGCKRKP